MGFISLENYDAEADAAAEAAANAPSDVNSDAGKNEQAHQKNEEQIDAKEKKLILPERIALDTADELYNNLIKLDLTTIETLTLDPKQIVDIDFVGLQLLCSLYVSCQQNEVKLSWLSENEPLLETAQELNLEDAIGL